MTISPGVDTTDFISVRRYLEDNDRWIWVWHKDDVDNLDFVTNRWINSTRDSLLQIYIRGSREDAFVRTDYRQEYQTELLEINGSQVYESRGGLGNERLLNGWTVPELCFP